MPTIATGSAAASRRVLFSRVRRSRSFTAERSARTTSAPGVLPAAVSEPVPVPPDSVIGASLCEPDQVGQGQGVDVVGVRGPLRALVRPLVRGLVHDLVLPSGQP